jgi:hypothetical protein
MPAPADDIFWETLTSLIEVKARLQSCLSQQPEYRALVILDQTISQLSDILALGDEAMVAGGLADPAADARIAANAVREIEGPAPNDAPAEDRRTDSALAIADALNEISSVVDGPLAKAAPFRFVAPAYEPPNAAPDAGPREDRLGDAAQASAGAVNGFAAVAIARLPRAAILRVAALDEPPRAAPRDDRLADMARPIGVLADEPGAANAPDPVPDISGMAALYDSARAASGIAPREDRGAETPGGPAAAMGDAKAVAPNSANPGGPPLEAPPTQAAASGLAAALYESAGDAPDAAHPEDRLGDAPLPPSGAADEAASAAPEAFDRILAKSAQTVSPAAKSPASGSYSPLVAGQRLIQARRH